MITDATTIEVLLTMLILLQVICIIKTTDREVNNIEKNLKDYEQR